MHLPHAGDYLTPLLNTCSGFQASLDGPVAEAKDHDLAKEG